jgi:hypothetical protein
MLPRNRIVTGLTIAAYLLVVCGASLFHDHHDDCHDDHHNDCHGSRGHGGEQPSSGLWASHVTDEHDCQVCQFLAQQPAPADSPAPGRCSLLIHGVFAPAPPWAVECLFLAWHSRAPPLV